MIVKMRFQGISSDAGSPAEVCRFFFMGFVNRS